MDSLTISMFRGCVYPNLNRSACTLVTRVHVCTRMIPERRFVLPRCNNSRKNIFLCHSFSPSICESRENRLWRWYQHAWGIVLVSLHFAFVCRTLWRGDSKFRFIIFLFITGTHAEVLNAEIFMKTMRETC